MSTVLLALDWLLRIRERTPDYHRCRACQGWEGGFETCEVGDCAERVAPMQRTAKRNRAIFRRYARRLVARVSSGETTL